MWKNELFSEITQQILGKRLGKAINMLENYLLSHPRQQELDELNNIKNDYRLMAEYWKKGFSDPQREQVYRQLLRRLYVLTTNVAIHERIRNTLFMSNVYSRPRNARKNWSVQSLNNNLENFVTDIAMLDLEPEDARQQKAQQIYSEHQQMMNDLFDYIWTSRLWKESLANFFEEVLLSPTIDVRDQQLIVSAITLSTMSNFCINKFRVLVNVYKQAVDEQLRQRALVGWVLSADSEKVRLYNEMADMVRDLCNDSKVCQELTELQMQMMLCMSAEDDTKKIQNEIIPDIIKGNNLRITRQGIQEQEEDALENILHPDAAEENMERMEASIHRMIDMQKQGADIYFGGFSQMKRFPFFQSISNWFVPFYPEHPGIAQTWQQPRGHRLLKTIVELGAFCDSDKYSFVIAFNQVLNHLPKQMLSMIEQGEASPIPIGGEVPKEEQRQPAFIRRLYLQNLYRFFRLYGQRDEFSNPFETARSVFFANPLFRNTALEGNMVEMASFFSKKKRYEEALSVLENVEEAYQEFGYFMLMGHLMMHRPERYVFPLHTSADYYRQALKMKPQNQQALMGYARACFAEQDYQQALDAYNQLLLKDDNAQNRTAQLNASVCLANLKRYDEALKVLYKLNYLFPEDKDVTRVLAWVLAVDAKYEQAIKLYNQLLSIEKPQPNDMLNYGYCLWFSGDIVSAVGMFRQFLTDHNDPQFSMEQELMVTEHDLISDHGISEAEIQLMLDYLFE